MPYPFCEGHHALFFFVRIVSVLYGHVLIGYMLCRGKLLFNLLRTNTITRAPHRPSSETPTDTPGERGFTPFDHSRVPLTSFALVCRSLQN